MADSFHRASTVRRSLGSSRFSKKPRIAVTLRPDCIAMLEPDLKELTATGFDSAHRQVQFRSAAGTCRGQDAPVALPESDAPRFDWTNVLLDLDAEADLVVAEQFVDYAMAMNPGCRRHRRHGLFEKERRGLRNARRVREGPFDRQRRADADPAGAIASLSGLAGRCGPERDLFRPVTGHDRLVERPRPRSLGPAAIVCVFAARVERAAWRRV